VDEKMTEIENLDSLIVHVERIQETEEREAIELYRNLKDYKWLHLLPTIGYNVYANSPEISISVSQYINYKTNKDAKKYQTEQIKQKSRQELERKTYELRKAYTHLVKLLSELELRHEALQINAQIFEIEQQKYENTEINTEEYLKLKRSYLQQQINHQTFKTSVHQAITEIEQITKRELVVKVPLIYNF
jgi:protein involved in ribonucleotide reduction